MNIRRCNPLYGYGWLRAGLALFFAQPWPWLALTSAGFVLTLVVGTLPILGLLAVFLLSPALTAGYMAAARAVAGEKPLSFTYLTAGLRAAARPLIGVGGVNLFVVLTALLIFVLGWRQEVTRLLELMGSAKPDQAVLEEALTQLTLPTLLMAALFLPLAMANWFAPALVLFRGLSTGAALRLSLKASLRNVWPFLVYGVLLFLLDAIASLVLQGIVALTLRIAGQAVAEILGLVLAFPVFCAFAAVIFASMYASYMDVFERPAQAAQS
ncbi:BPSS1780 family membrane protein [Thiobacter aerophilum]|uniref:BPSS1780 family membrane protein n=1 Tax=Thiobacter aerophilum TaxID=3121275 RepID=A0ABV0ECX0_9BURK